MKTLLYSFACLLLTSIFVTAEPSVEWELPEIRDGVADLIQYDQNEFVAMKLLLRVQSGAAPTKTKYMPIITDAGVDAARKYLLEKRFNWNDEFQEKRVNAQFNAMLTAGDEPFKSIATVTHVKLDFYEYLIKDYDFEKSAFPFQPYSGGGFSMRVSISDASRPFAFELLHTKYLAIEPELAERWKTSKGSKLIAVCRVGKGFATRQGIPAVRAECEKIEFRTGEGELLKEILIPSSGRNIDNDYTVEEVTKRDASDVGYSQKTKRRGSSRIPVIVCALLVMAGVAWRVLKIRSSNNTRHP